MMVSFARGRAEGEVMLVVGLEGEGKWRVRDKGGEGCKVIARVLPLMLD